MVYGMGYLGRDERAVLRRLSPMTQRLILSELQSDPSQAEGIKELLREPDPERAVARSISEAVSQAVGAGITGHGLGFRAPRWSNVVETVTNVVQSVEQVVSKAAETVSNVAQRVEAAAKRVGVKGVVARLLAIPTGGASLLLDPKIRKKAAEYAKKYGPMAITLAAIAVSFIPGVGIPIAVAITTLNTGYQALQAKKRQAKAAESAASADAAALQAAADQQEQELLKQMDDTYVAYPDLFTSLGYPPAKWDSMSVDEKYAVFSKLDELVAAAEKEIADMAAADAAYQENWEAMTKAKYTPERWATMTLIEKQDALKAVLTAPAPTDGTAPDTTPAPTDGGEAPQAPIDTGGMISELVVEGKSVFSTGKGLDFLMTALGSYVTPGDRFEILVNGKSTGLKVMTAAGPISVPAEQEAQVRGATPEQMRNLVAKAAEAGKQGGFPVWLLAAPVAIYAATR
jgi:hypothetical protein